MKAAITGLLGDRAMWQKLTANAAEMQRNPGNESAAAAIMGLLVGRR